MSGKHENRLAGKLFLCLIGLMLLLIGGVFEWLMVRSYQQASASRNWPEVEAVILRSVVAERQMQGSPKEYSLSVRYQYSFHGKEMISERITPRGAKWTKDTRRLKESLEKYTTSSTHTAWVNPDVVGFAILEHDTKAAGYTLWFPALIMIGGLGMIAGAFKKEGFCLKSAA